MIKLNKYKEDFENEYYNIVESAAQKDTEKYPSLNIGELTTSARKYLPDDFFVDTKYKDDDFKTLILSPYEKLKNAYEYISKDAGTMEKECFDDEVNDKGEIKTKLTETYNKLYSLYPKIRDSAYGDLKMNVAMVESLGINVCPYCNRDFINSRGKKSAGAQLDHFYAKDKFPIFSVCLYNLVPVCANCNRVKSNKRFEFVSPFDQTFDFDNNLKFSYLPTNDCNVKLIIQAKGSLFNNIEQMQIFGAYEINHTAIEELIYKAKVYNTSTIKELVEIEGLNFSESEIKNMVFGTRIEPASFSNQPLSKLKSDILKELKIWKD